MGKAQAVKLLDTTGKALNSSICVALAWRGALLERRILIQGRTPSPCPVRALAASSLWCAFVRPGPIGTRTRRDVEAEDCGRPIFQDWPRTHGLLGGSRSHIWEIWENAFDHPKPNAVVVPCRAGSSAQTSGRPTRTNWCQQLAQRDMTIERPIAQAKCFRPTFSRGTKHSPSFMPTVSGV